MGQYGKCGYKRIKMLRKKHILFYGEESLKKKGKTEKKLTKNEYCGNSFLLVLLHPKTQKELEEKHDFLDFIKLWEILHYLTN